jgi:uncharacterized protein YndB with AHSA1/START domain
MDWRIDRHMAYLAGALILGVSAPAIAAVTNAGPTGFTVSESVMLKAAPDKVYAALVRPEDWWSGKHSFSGDAKNFHLSPHAGGCWCETLPNGGFVEHMRVVYAAPGKALRLRGSLGPMQGMGMIGAMSWTLTPAKRGTALTLTYDAGGHDAEGFKALAGAVDAVLHQQVERLARLLDTGNPDARTSPPRK